MPTVGSTRVGSAGGSLSYGGSTSGSGSTTVSTSGTSSGVGIGSSSGSGTTTTGSTGTTTGSGTSSGTTTSGIKSVGGVNVGNGTGIFSGVTGTTAPVLDFKTILVSGGLSISSTANTITLSGSGSSGSTSGASAFLGLSDGPGTYSPGALLLSTSNSVVWSAVPSAPAQTLIWNGAHLGYGGLTVNTDNNITATGNALSSTGLSLALKPTGVTANTYNAPNLTIDQFGRITSATSNTSVLVGAQSLGNGQPIYVGTSGGVLQFASVTAGLGITLNTSQSSLIISETPSGLLPGNYTNASVSVDQNGRIVAIANGVVTSSGTQVASSVTNIVAGVGISVVPTNGTYTVGLSGATSAAVATYTNPTISIDSYGRIVTASSGSASSGTVTPTVVAAGTGVTVASSGGTYTVSASGSATATTVVGGYNISVASSNGTYTVSEINGAAAAGNYSLANITIDSHGKIASISSGAVANSGSSSPSTTVQALTTPTVAQWQTQSALMGWNYTNGGGELDLFSSYGAGSGGVNFYKVASNASSIPVLLASINGVGSLNANAINNTPIGGGVPAPGYFTSLLSNGSPVITSLAASGDVTGVYSSGNIVLSLPQVVAAGTYAYPASLAVDAKGRVVSITAGSGSSGTSVPSTLSVGTITNSGTLGTVAISSGSLNVNFPVSSGTSTSLAVGAVTTTGTKGTVAISAGSLSVNFPLPNVIGTVTTTGTLGTAVISNGALNINFPAPSSVSSAGTAPSTYASNTYFNGYFTGSLNVPAGTTGVAIPFTADADAGGNTTGGGTSSFIYTVPVAGHYQMRLTVQFLTTGTAANSSTSAPAAPPTGTDFGACISLPFGTNPVIYSPTGPKRNFITTFSDLYLNKGGTIAFYAYCDSANAVTFASVSMEQVYS